VERALLLLVTIFFCLSPALSLGVEPDQHGACSLCSFLAVASYLLRVLVLSLDVLLLLFVWV